jgi:hypothetical protein
VSRLSSALAADLASAKADLRAVKRLFKKAIDTLNFFNLSPEVTPAWLRFSDPAYSPYAAVIDLLLPVTRVGSQPLAYCVLDALHTVEEGVVEKAIAHIGRVVQCAHGFSSDGSASPSGNAALRVFDAILRGLSWPAFIDGRAYEAVSRGLLAEQSILTGRAHRSSIVPLLASLCPAVVPSLTTRSRLLRCLALLARLVWLSHEFELSVLLQSELWDVTRELNQVFFGAFGHFVGTQTFKNHALGHLAHGGPADQSGVDGPLAFGSLAALSTDRQEKDNKFFKADGEHTNRASGTLSLQLASRAFERFYYQLILPQQQSLAGGVVVSGAKNGRTLCDAARPLIDAAPTLSGRTDRLIIDPPLVSVHGVLTPEVYPLDINVDKLNAALGASPMAAAGPPETFSFGASTMYFSKKQIAGARRDAVKPGSCVLLNVYPDGTPFTESHGSDIGTAPATYVVSFFATSHNIIYFFGYDFEPTRPDDPKLADLQLATPVGKNVYIKPRRIGNVFRMHRADSILRLLRDHMYPAHTPAVFSGNKNSPMMELPATVLGARLLSLHF